jgi:hypothetical protein
VRLDYGLRRTNPTDIESHDETQLELCDSCVAINYGCLNCSDSVSIPDIIKVAWRIPIPLRIGLVTSNEQVETESGLLSSEEFLEAQVRGGVLDIRTYRKSTVLPLSKSRKCL